MRILSIPGRRTPTQYVPLFCDSLDAAGLSVVDVDSADAFLFRFDILHLHFPHFYIVEKRAVVALLWYLIFAAAFCATKLLGKHVVYTVHDVTPFHYRNEWLLWPFLGMVHRAADGFVFLNPSSQAEFYRRNPQHRHKPALLLGHAAFPVPMPDQERRRQRRAAIVGDPDALLVGYLGYRRARKGLETLTLLPQRLADGRAVRLLVAGGVQPAFAAESDAILRRVPADMLTVRNVDLSDSELNEMIQNVDIVLMPYTIGWNSGMALLILSNRARCLGSDLPMFTDLEAAVGAPWVYTFSRTGHLRDNLAAALERAAAAAPTEADQANLERFLEANSLARGAARLRDFYQALVGRPEPQREAIA